MPAFRPLRVFGELTSSSTNLGFYTFQSMDDIPEQPGCYAWMLPLWIFHQELDPFLESVTNLLNREKSTAKLTFNWDSVALNAVRKTDSDATEGKTTTWNTLVHTEEGRRSLQQALLEASIFLPPLYVGRTDNLKRRYLEHTQPTNREVNDFHSRLQQRIEDLGLKLSPSDLLFVSLVIRSPSRHKDSSIQEEVTETDFTALIEWILMRACRPALSKR